MGPSSDVLPTTHIYAALIILVLGVMLGKFFLWIEEMATFVNSWCQLKIGHFNNDLLPTRFCQNCMWKKATNIPFLYLFGSIISESLISTPDWMLGFPVSSLFNCYTVYYWHPVKCSTLLFSIKYFNRWENLILIW